MDKKRKAYAPFSLTSEAGVAQTPVEGYIDVNQAIYPTVNTGTINENGKWAGVKSDDREFFGQTRAVAIPNGGEFLAPDTSEVSHLDMTGFVDLFLAIKPSRGGAYGIQAVMGPDTVRFANLEPVNAAVELRGLKRNDSSASMSNLLVDSSDSLTADVWNIFTIQSVLQGQKNLQFKITNSSGDTASFVEVAFMRLV